MSHSDPIKALTSPRLLPLMLASALLAIAPWGATARAEDDESKAEGAAEKAPATTDDDAAATWPWKLGRPTTYDWFVGKKKVGRIVFTTERIEDADGDFYRIEAHRDWAHDGRSETCETKLDVTVEGSPLRYREERRIELVRGTAVQEWMVDVVGATARAKCVNNGKDEAATRQEVELPKGALLFSTGSIEQWNLVTRRLRGDEETDLPVYYPPFARVVKIRFRPAEEPETRSVGDREVEVRRWDFEYLEFGDSGSVWVDAEGRLVGYRSGTTRVELRN